MTKIFKYILPLAVVAVWLAGCKEDTLDRYQDESNVYFTMNKWPSPTLANQKVEIEHEGVTYSIEFASLTKATRSLSFSFDRLPGEQQTAVTIIPVSIMGHLSPVDREFGWKVLPTSKAVEGEDFRVLGAFIPANATDGALIVEMSRANLGGDVFLRADFELVPNDNFSTNYQSIIAEPQSTERVSTINFSLVFDDYLTPPPLWSTYYMMFYGNLSKKKLDILMNLIGVPEEVMYSETWLPEYMALNTAWGSLFKRYLIEEKNAGRTVYEADNKTEMTWGSLIP